MAFAQIIPNQKTKGGISFDYKIPPEINVSIGSLVEVPFGRRKIFGIVAKISPRSKFANKEIIRTLSAGPVFTKLQFDLAEKIALEHFSTFSETIFSFLPLLNKKDLKKISNDISPRQKKQSHKQLLLGSLDSGLEFFAQSADLDDTQSLIVLPTISNIEKIYHRLKKLLPQKQIFSWHSNLASSEKAGLWQKCANGESLIIISTRHGLFLPFARLESVLIWDPTNFAYQDDQAPYYNAYKSALYLSNISKCDLYIAQSSPDLLSHVALKQGKIKLHETKINLEISNGLRWQDLSKNLGTFERIKTALTKNKRVCVIGPLKNQIKLFCEDCKKIQSCPKCKKAYFDQTSLTCSGCHNSFSLCTFCQSPKLMPLGFSYTKIMSELENLFGLLAKKIIVVSAREIHTLTPPVDLVIFPYFDLMIDFPYLGYRQKLYRLVLNLESISAKEVILFGDNLAQSDFVDNLISKNWRGFLDGEIRERKISQLPPFTRAIEIVAKDKGEPSAKRELNKFIEKILPDFPAIPLECEVTSRSYKYSAVIFVKPADFEKFKNVALKNQSKGLHFEIDRGEYL